MAAWDRNVRDSDIWVAAPTQFDQVFVFAQTDDVHAAWRSPVARDCLQNELVFRGRPRNLDQILLIFEAAAVVGNRVGVGLLAQFAVEVLPVVGDAEVCRPNVEAGFKPILQTLYVHLLDGAWTGTQVDQRVVISEVLTQANAARLVWYLLPVLLGHYVADFGVHFIAFFVFLVFRIQSFYDVIMADFFDFELDSAQFEDVAYAEFVALFVLVVLEWAHH